MDYTRMKATQVSAETYRTANGRDKTSARQIKHANKVLGLSATGWLCVSVFLLVGVLAGWGVNFLLCGKDVYQMVAGADGEVDVVIGKNEATTTYVEMGVKCVAFGQDCSRDVKVTYYYRKDLTEAETEVSGVDENVSGIYYAVYTCSQIKYRTVKLIRNIVVLQEEDNG